MPLEPLPNAALMLRLDNKWEREDDDARVEAAIYFARDKLAEIFVCQNLGGDPDDDNFMDRVDEMYDVIRDGTTRQDLIRAVLILVQDAAAGIAQRDMTDFRSGINVPVNFREEESDAEDVFEGTELDSGDGAGDTG